MLEIRASAPGKLILHGEHAVVHGKLAVAASLDLRASLVLTLNDDAKVKLSLAELNIDIDFPLSDLPQVSAEGASSTQLDQPLYQAIHTLVAARDELSEGLESRRFAVEALLYLYCGIVKATSTQEQDEQSPSGVTINVKSDLPIGAGLGSSAAYSVCLASSMLALTRPIDAANAADLDAINAWAFLSESIIHGKPSGLDNTISCFGGAVSFASGKFNRVSTFQSLEVVLVDTGVPRSTKALVSGVRERKHEFPAVMDPLLDSMGHLSQTFLDISQQLAETSDTDPLFTKLETLMTMNHHMLNAIGVGHPALDDVVRLASSLGLAAKLTGAGGGGCAYVLLRPHASEDVKAKLFAALKEKGLRYWTTSLGGAGVAVERSDANQ
ncbi:hypothetical protein PTSG_09431 [Salpingoeca rosetta]|uniref:Mevalonate kinase n=1 Tax=Salpingoeca rosetta (strain ATCC 50818 / BSB-021) TaxID=946362 RepID=F2UML6_SALR5|nr:uncharacterized protein PTSG_09431 [Salpingoeca rosetta]EGD78365.1 hypothetical protein PTSG_09431 [Salpingoeca rosetta]|eukprot:XP_004989688.1 hypothetical protein PTSG_09431 [Salpingoeca rosetta]